MNKDLKEARGKPQKSAGLGEGTLGREESKYKGPEVGKVDGVARRSGWEAVGDSPEGREPEHGGGGSD